MTTKDGTALMPILGIGSMCTQTLVHAKQRIPVDKELSLEQMSLIGLEVLTGVGAGLHTAGIGAGQSLPVIRCGGVGNSIGMSANLGALRRSLRSTRIRASAHGTRALGPSAPSTPRTASKAISGGMGVDASFALAFPL